MKKLFWINYQNSEKKETDWIIRNYVRTFFYLVVIAIIVFSFMQINYRINNRGWSLFRENFINLFKFNNLDKVHYPSNTILFNSLTFMWQTFLFTTLGTFFGFLFALFTTIMGSKFLFNKIFTLFINLGTIFLRSFPAIIIIYAVKEGFEKSLAASIILFWFSWLWSNRYLQDIFNNANLELFKLYQQKGFSKLKAFYKSVISINLNKILMILFFSLEANIRFSAILGSFSLPGIGTLVNNAFQDDKYQNLGIPILIIILTIFLLEILIFIFNRWILINRSKELNPKYIKKIIKKYFDFRNIFKIVIFLFFIVICVFQMLQIEFNKVFWASFFRYISNIFHPDLSLWKNDLATNPWFSSIKLLLNSFTVIIFAFTMALAISFFCCSKIMPPYISLTFKGVNILFRAIPHFIIFIILNPLFIDPTLIGIISVTFGTTSVLVKQFTESFNTVSKQKIAMYSKKGKSLAWIFIFCMFSDVKKDLVSYAYFAYNNALRSLLVLGVFGVSDIGATISGYEKRDLIFKISAYVWPIFIILLTLEIAPTFISYYKGWKITNF